MSRGYVTDIFFTLILFAVSQVTLELLTSCADYTDVPEVTYIMFFMINYPQFLLAIRGETGALIWGRGGGEGVNIHIFVFCPTKFS